MRLSTRAVAVFADQSRRFQKFAVEALDVNILLLGVAVIVGQPPSRLPEQRPQVAMLDPMLACGRWIGETNPADGCLVAHDRPPVHRQGLGMRLGGPVIYTKCVQPSVQKIADCGHLSYRFQRLAYITRAYDVR